MPRPPMRNRVVRTSDPDWEAALEEAEASGEVLAEQIRQFIHDYGHRRAKKKR